jgi:uncharacterized glyoxalase superfamily protein PhnB
MKIEALTPNLKVENIKNTLNFYKEILDFQVVMVLPEKEPIWALLQNNGFTIMFQQKKSFEEECPHLEKIQGGSFFLYIKISQLDSFYQNIKDKVKIMKHPHVTSYKMKELAIEDCNGYFLVFAEEQ